MRKTSGINLIEVTLIVAIISIIGAIVITGFIKAGEKANQEKVSLEKASPSKKDAIIWNCLGGPSHGNGWSATVYWVINPTTQDTVYILPGHGIFVLPAKPVTAEAIK